MVVGTMRDGGEGGGCGDGGGGRNVGNHTEDAAQRGGSTRTPVLCPLRALKLQKTDQKMGGRRSRER